MQIPTDPLPSEDCIQQAVTAITMSTPAYTPSKDFYLNDCTRPLFEYVL